ncbi:HIT family protein [bacterium]|nr:HIT family protein [bacterium]
MTAAAPCPFCLIINDPSHKRIERHNDHAVLIRDGFPVTDGHSLVIPKRHVGSFFDASDDERQAMLALVDEAKSLLDQEFGPDAYNIGINDGPAAGQTVPHLHVHLIPRYEEEGSDPRGGVRWVVAGKADYWSGVGLA